MPFAPFGGGRRKNRGIRRSRACEIRKRPGAIHSHILRCEITRKLAQSPFPSSENAVALIVIVGDVTSFVHPKVLDSTLLLPAGSEYAPAATLME
ncbi:unnamed protein product [Bathycoccus prasinos]